MAKFPKNFFWGAATSAHQVEGNNSKSDWWGWERSDKSRFASGDACRHYQLFDQDLHLASQLNHNAHRFSTEWSRIEPDKGQFIKKEIEHYTEVILCLKRHGLEPLVTLNHFTLPLWLKEEGGWLNKNAVDYFLRYVNEVVTALSPYLRYWITINEPLVYIYNCYIRGIWPPQKRSILKAKKAADNLSRAHQGAYKIIKRIYRQKRLGPAYVSIAKHMRGFICNNKNPYYRMLAGLKDYIFNFRLLNYLTSLNTLDYIGINYYTADFIPEKGAKSNDFARSNLGWPICPEYLLYLLLRLKRYNLAVFILENGISTDDDAQRWEFISSHLLAVNRALQEGVDIIGYLHWSLLDNFEWEKGFQPRFGLIGVDYQTFKRRVKESAVKFSQVCKTANL